MTMHGIADRTIKRVQAERADPHMTEFTIRASPRNLLHRERFAQKGDPILDTLNHRYLLAHIKVMRAEMGERRWGILSRKVGRPDVNRLTGKQSLARAARRKERRNDR